MAGRPQSPQRWPSTWHRLLKPASAGRRTVKPCKTLVLNAVLLLPLLAFLYGISRDRNLMGRFRAGRAAAVPYLIAIAGIAVCITALAVTAFT